MPRRAGQNSADEPRLVPAAAIHVCSVASGAARGCAFFAIQVRPRVRDANCRCSHLPSRSRAKQCRRTFARWFGQPLPRPFARN
eukprot:11181207-Lingulodinium_polyedra.AAC.1